MQPLKRFTQCGSLTMLFAVFIVLFGVSSTALTTFGKSNNAPIPTTPPIKGKLCLSQQDCLFAPQTTCIKDPVDKQMRCLCGDFEAPINSYCLATHKGLRHLCNHDKNCEEGMICTVDNSTSKTTTPSSSSGFGIKNNFNNSSAKICLCNEDEFFFENPKELTCNGAVTLMTGIFVPLLSLIIGTFLAKKPSFIIH